MGDKSDGLRRHFGLWQATALNVAMVVGAGVFVFVPKMLQQLPGAWALLGWLAVGALALVDGLVWAELGAALPGSGGSYVYLLESYGRQRWGRLMAFLFIWQFLLSGPLELASGFIAADSFAQAFSPDFAAFNKRWTYELVFSTSLDLKMTFSPARVGCALLVLVLVFLLYRRVESLARLTLVFGLGVLAAGAWLVIEGLATFDSSRALAVPAQRPDLAAGLAGAMVLALYCYLGYYNICYIGDEVREPGRTIPRSVLFSVLIVAGLFVALHLTWLGTVPWEKARDAADDTSYNLPAAFMKEVRGETAARVLLLVLIGTCTISAFAGLLSYSRIPYGAARAGHFFAAVGRAHPRHHIPHVALLLVGLSTAWWCFFDLDKVVSALIATRLPGQFVAQALGLILLRRSQPGLHRPYRMALYPLPALMASAGWLALWLAMGWGYVAFSVATLAVGAAVFLGWSWRGRTWPFGKDVADLV